MEVRRSSPVPSVVVAMRVVCCALWLICRTLPVACCLLRVIRCTLPVGCGSCRAAYEDSTKECKGLLETIDDLEQMVGAHIAGLFHFSAYLSTDRVDRGWSCPTALVPTIASAMPIQYCLADHE